MDLTSFFYLPVVVIQFASVMFPLLYQSSMCYLNIVFMDICDECMNDIYIQVSLCWPLSRCMIQLLAKQSIKSIVFQHEQYYSDYNCTQTVHNMTIIFQHVLYKYYHLLLALHTSHCLLSPSSVVSGAVLLPTKTFTNF